MPCFLAGLSIVHLSLHVYIHWHFLGAGRHSMHPATPANSSSPGRRSPSRQLMTTLRIPMHALPSRGDDSPRRISTVVWRSCLLIVGLVVLNAALAGVILTAVRGFNRFVTSAQRCLCDSNKGISILLTHSPPRRWQPCMHLPRLSSSCLLTAMTGTQVNCCARCCAD